MELWIWYSCLFLKYIWNIIESSYVTNSHTNTNWNTSRLVNKYLSNWTFHFQNIVFRHIQYIKVEIAATGENFHLFFCDKEHKPACSRNRSFCYIALKVQNAFPCVNVTQFVLLLDCCCLVFHALHLRDKWRGITTVINSCHNRKFLEHIRRFSNKTVWCMLSMYIMIKRNTLPGFLQCAVIPTAFTAMVTLLKSIPWKHIGQSKVAVPRILNLGTKRRWVSDQLHVQTSLLSPDVEWKGGRVCRDYWVRKLVTHGLKLMINCSCFRGRTERWVLEKQDKIFSA
jgi:hypothetical protein